MSNELNNFITNGIASLLGLPEAVVTSIPTVYKAYREQRIFNFLKYTNFTIDRISVNDCNKIRKLISSNEGKILLSKYLEEAIAVDSEVARMALAILFSDDPDFIFESHIKNIIFIAIKELDDRAINFYIDITNTNLKKEAKKGNITSYRKCRVGTMPEQIIHNLLNRNEI